MQNGGILLENWYIYSKYVCVFLNGTIGGFYFEGGLYIWEAKLSHWGALC